MNAVQEGAAAERNLRRVFGERAQRLPERVVIASREALPVVEVWLLGSCAGGDAGRESDLALLGVVEDKQGLRRPSRAAFKAGNRLADVPPADVVALTKTRWEHERPHPSGWFGDAAAGICLYAK